MSIAEEQKRTTKSERCSSIVVTAWSRGFRRRRALAVLMVFALGGVLWLGACDQATSPRQPLVVGTNVWPGYEPLYLARTLKFFGASGIKFAEYSSATQVLRAFRNGAIQVAALTLDEALLLRESGIDVCVILVTDISNGGDAILVAPGIDGLKHLKGKRIAVENTALGAYVLARALQRAEISLADITVVSREIDEHESAVAGKDVDAVVTFEPVRSRLLAQGMTEVFDSSMIPGEIVDVLVVRRETLTSRSDQLTLLLEGWFKALRYFEEQPASAAKHMAPRLQMGPNEVLASYQGLLLPGFEENMRALGGPAPSLDGTVARLAEVMKALALLDPSADLAGMASSDILMTLKNTRDPADSVRDFSEEK